MSGQAESLQQVVSFFVTPDDLHGAHPGHGTPWPLAPPAPSPLELPAARPARSGSARNARA